jgi:hypothetical protein
MDLKRLLVTSHTYVKNSGDRAAVKLIPLVSKVERAGVLKNCLHFTYSQNRLAALLTILVAFMWALRPRNFTTAGDL